MSMATSRSSTVKPAAGLTRHAAPTKGHMDIEDLRQREKEMWAKCTATKEAHEAAIDAWLPVREQLNEAELREKIKAEARAMIERGEVGNENVLRP